MKKFIAIFSAILIITAFPLTAFADVKPVITTTENEYIEYYSDGSYTITEFETNTVSPMAATSKVHTKTASHYNSKNEKQWTVKLTGTFKYDGKSAVCTKSSTSYTIYNDHWKVKSAAASKSGRTAKGEFTVKYYVLGVATKTVNKTLTISCSNTGSFS